MKIEKDSRVVEGKHNGQKFELNGGYLIMFGRAWAKGEVKTLVETVNLIKHETGIDLVDKKFSPPRKQGEFYFGQGWALPTDTDEPEEN